MGLKQIQGFKFLPKNGVWTATFNDRLELTLGGSDGNKYTTHDSSDGSKEQFKTMTAAHDFLKRRKHGRTMEEHLRAEDVQNHREKMGWSIGTMAKKLCVSPRTVEAWSSGARAVPKIIIVALNGF